MIFEALFQACRVVTVTLGLLLLCVAPVQAQGPSFPLDRCLSNCGCGTSTPPNCPEKCSEGTPTYCYEPLLCYCHEIGLNCNCVTKGK